MENASKALFIAISVLIAIMIISLILFGWRIIGSVESTRDDVAVVKNKADFNAEFEVYRKNLMYGTDVLSCLNKAQDNNQRYVYNNYYGSTDKEKSAREEYFMDVVVTIKDKALYDTIEAYYKTSTGKYSRVLNASGSNYDDMVLSGTGVNKFDNPTIYYYYFQSGKLIQASNTYTAIMGIQSNRALGYYVNLRQIPTNFTPGTYHLLQPEDSSSRGVSSTMKSAMLSALITTVGLKEQKIVNSIQPSAVNESDWWYCTWVTAANDFKTRKFKCNGVTYNEDNGYIERIEFEEIRNF